MPKSAPARNPYGRGSYYKYEDADGRTIYQASRSFMILLEDGSKVRRRVTGTGDSANVAFRRLEERVKLFHSKGGEKIAPKPQRTAAETITVEEFVGLWHDHMIGRLDPVSDVVLSKYMTALNKHVVKHIGSLPVAELEPKHMAQLFRVTLPALKKRNGEPLLGSQGLLNVYKALNPVLNYAVRETSTALTTNPLSKRDLLPRVERPDEPISEWADATGKLLQGLKDHPDKARHLLPFLAIRKSEKLGLEWSKITNLYANDGSARMKIEQQLARYQNGDGLYINTKLKTRSSKREIPIPRLFLEALRGEKAKQDEWKKSPSWNPEPRFKNLVFTTNTGKPITQNADNLSWRKVLKENGLAFRGHAARHITATLFARQENPPIPLSTVRAILGHSTETMTAYYTAAEAKILVNPLTQYGDYLDASADSAQENVDFLEQVEERKSGRTYKATDADVETSASE
jgi:integrase